MDWLCQIPANVFFTVVDSNLMICNYVVYVYITYCLLQDL